jgi:hypothetical protein
LKAQTEQNIGFGINLSKNITNLALGNYKYDRGICIEPVLLYRINDLINVKSTSGYSRLSRQHILLNTNNAYQEINFINKGVYIKTGIYSSFKAQKKLFYNSIGLSLAYSQFNESGNYTIKGAYFGDLKEEYKVKGQKILFLESSLDLYVYQNKHIAILTSFNLPIPIYSSIDNDYPNYYIPGYGERIMDHLPSINYIISRFEIYIMIPL